ncbi:prephenate dehydrogenase [Haliovirga abyssi]|uniref:Prephenate dehydrogenase n=1 Tax=Haliovirga abyssi TaxID=2996794 RepID=A0AAU9DBS6_9FUSO|nr:prephenate dehydrogenase [Haliovirga abyssi]BDU50740.1 prephenate dehydrogenase [Haliovirga abyssi]
MKVAIWGVGLLGGSIGYILKKKKWSDKVIGIGRNSSKLEKAVSLNAIDEYMIELDDRLSEIDILVLSVPVKLMPNLVKRALPYLKKGAIITDVGSTKEYITKEIENILPKDIYFVGGHPMAGSEKTGVEALDPYLFENAIYVLTKTKNTNLSAFEKVKEMVKKLDSTLLELDVEIHDLAVASISHLPHILASSLVNTANDISNNNQNIILSLAAGGFRDTTRIAAGSPEMWRDICLTNRDKILYAIDKFKKELSNFEENIKNGNEEMLTALFRNGKEVRDKIPQRRKGILSPMIELIVFVPDKPGIIGDITKILGRNNINIKDIEVLHIRENYGGSIRVGFDVNKENEKAEEVLKNAGFEVKELK